MPENITQIKLKFSCQENWDEMKPVEGGRFCHKCNKTVYDFTGSKADEFRKILAENPGACGKYNGEQVTLAPRQLPVWKKWLAAAVVLVGFNFSGSKAIAQAILSPRDTSQKVANKHDDNAYFGATEISAQFPGGLTAFSDFLKNNLHYTGEARGRVIVQFMVETDGSLTNIHVVRSIGDEAADKEALRVIALSPKWKPGIQNNKPVRQQYTVPISFNLPPK